MLRDDAKKQSDTVLYLLPDNKPESLAEIKAENAVVLFPDSSSPSSSSSGSRKYKACFIQQGKLLKAEVALGNHALTGKGLLPKTTPHYDNLINMALSKARIKIPSLLRIPTAVMHDCIIPGMDTKALARFSQTSCYASALTPSTVLHKRKVEKLLNHVIRGEEEQAKKMLEANPRLLLESAVVTDYSGRQIEGTAFQLALGAIDAEMCEMIAPYFTRLTDGEVEKSKQYQKQFPDQESKKEKSEVKAEETADIAALRQVIHAIRLSNTDEECEPALQAFRDFLKPKGVIKTGNHFNPELLLTAFQLYDQNYDAFDGWDSRKNNLCWRKVIGYIQRFLPACFAQAFCYGLYDLVENRHPLKRSLEFRFDPGYFFFPLASSSALGYEYAAVRPCLGGCWWGGDPFARVCFLQNLCRSKTSALQRYAARASHETTLSVPDNVVATCRRS